MKVSAFVLSLLLSAASVSGKHHHHADGHQSWIRAESSCTTYEELLRISYDVSGEASDEDWIVLLPSEVGSNSHRVRSYIANAKSDKEYMWMTTSGDHETFEEVPDSHGDIAFQLHDDDDDDEDVESGSASSDSDEEHTQYFRLHMIRGRDTTSAHGMHLVTSSAPIKVSRECPKACQSWVEVSDTILTAGEDVGIRLDNCDVAEDDFVALVPAGDVENVDKMDPHSPSVWVWACGDRDCKEAVDTNGLALSTFLPAGKYVAVLSQRDGTLKAISQDEVRIDEPTNADGTACVDTAKVISSCMGQEDDFTVEISTCLPPRDGDWVGIFHHHSDPTPGQQYEAHMLAFVYACDEEEDDDDESNHSGPYTCTRTVSKTKHALDEAALYKSQGVAWPLAPGEYQVTLVHERSGISHVAKAPGIQESFAVHRDSKTCVESMNRRRRQFLRG